MVGRKIPVPLFGKEKLSKVDTAWIELSKMQGRVYEFTVRDNEDIVASCSLFAQGNGPGIEHQVYYVADDIVATDEGWKMKFVPLEKADVTMDKEVVKRYHERTGKRDRNIIFVTYRNVCRRQLSTNSTHPIEIENRFPPPKWWNAYNVFK